MKLNVRASLLAGGTLLFLGVLARSFPPRPALLDAEPILLKATPSGETVTVTVGTSFRRRIDDGEEHAYVAEIPPGHPAWLRVLQRDIDLSLVLELDGELWLDFPHGFRGEEVAVLPAGTTAFTVRTEQALVHPASYDLRLEAIPDGDEEALLRAQAAYARGLRRHMKSQPSDCAGAIDSYRTARDLWARLGGERQHAYASFHLGNCLYRGPDLEAAVGEMHSAIATLERQEDMPGVAWALSGLGQWWSQAGEARKAAGEQRRALSLAREIGDRQLEGLSANSLGDALDDLGEKRQAIAFYRQALQVFRQLEHRSFEATVAANLGSSLNDLGEHEAAHDMFRRALQIHRELGSKPGEGLSLHNLASLYDRIGRKQEALEHFHLALEIFDQLGHASGVAYVNHNLGRLYSTLGDPDLAVHYYDRALEGSRASGDRRLEGWVMGNLGGLYQKLGDRLRAGKLLLEGLERHRELENRRGEAFALNSLGRLAFDHGEDQRAGELWQQALAIWQEIGDRAGESDTLRNLGNLHAAAASTDGEAAFARADQHHARALALSRQIGDLDGEVRALLARARVERRRGRHHPALAQIEEAIAGVEAMRDRLASQEVQASFLASMRASYELRVELMIDLDRLEPGRGWAARAFTAAEEARARSLLDTLYRSGELRRGAPAPLLDRERELRRRLSAAHRRQVEGHNDGEGARIEGEIQGLLEQLHLVRGEIRRQSPNHAALTQPRPIALERLQSLLAADDLLLVFGRTEERIPLWVVGAGSFELVELPPRFEIETAARRHAGLLRRSHGEEALRAAEKVGRTLSRALLGPLAGRLDDQRLLVVAEGALLLVPFAALPHPEDPSDLLVERHEIVRLPSASVLELWTRPRQQRPPSVAVVADPVFSAADPRVRSTRPPSPPAAAVASTPITRSLRAFGRRELPRLLHSRREAEAIAAIAGPGTFQALDFDASRETVLGGELATYPILHLATHGLLNATHPELSGLVLSLVDPDGRGRDGFLRLHEVYDLELDADLVVLSGCDTALGEEVAGEGLIGLTRGFLHAGARGVVASLWAIEDRSTAVWMERFYDALLRRGLRPAAALREAQLALRGDAATASPYFWAGFEYQGAPDF